MITVRDFQAEAANMLVAEIETGGTLNFHSYVGCGLTIIISETARRIGKPVAYISRFAELREQMRRISEEMGVENLACVKPSDDVSSFYAVIASDKVSASKVSHDRVVVA